MTTPERKTEPARHLDAALVPLKNALQHRANELERDVKNKTTLNAASTNTWLAAEFRKLADELHHW